MNAQLDTTDQFLRRIVEIKKAQKKLADELAMLTPLVLTDVAHGQTINLPGSGVVSVVAESSSVSVDERKALMSILDVTSTKDIEAALVDLGVDVPVKVRVTKAHLKVRPNA